MKWLVFAGAITPWAASAQQSWTNGMRVEGTIADPCGAVIPGAHVRVITGETATTDTAGHYVLPCIPATSTTLMAQAEGFKRGTASARARQGGSAYVNLQLAIASLATDVQVGADASGIDSSSGAGTTNLGAREIQQLSR